MLIRTKRQYYELAKQGLAGNCVRTWDNVEECLATCTDPKVSFRSVTPGSNKFLPHVPLGELREMVRKLSLNEGEYYISATFDNTVEIRIAGELTWYEGDWVFFYSMIPGVMRYTLKEDGRHAVGYREVWGLLDQYMTPADKEDTLDLFERYTDQGRYPIIELSVTKSDLGIYPHRNTLIWEVRHY